MSDDLLKNAAARATAVAESIFGHGGVGEIESASASGAVSRDRWQWFGTPGHFIAADHCQFRMHTRIGDYRISTVGDYHPGGIDNERQNLGFGRTHETFVFRVSGPGEGKMDPIEIMTESYTVSDDPDGALVVAEGHVAMCERVARELP